MLTLVSRPNVEYLCDVKEDPFLYLQDHNKIYGTFKHF